MAELRLKTVNLRLKKAFALSKASASEKTTLIARYGSGVGEGSPSIHYGLDATDVVSLLRSKLGGDQIELPEEELLALSNELPDPMNIARSAFEMAIFDHRARTQGIPLHRYLSLEKPKDVASSLTITPGSDEEFESQMEMAKPFHSLKLKVGFPDDLAFVDRVLQRRPCRLRLDANGGWTTSETIERVKSLAGYPLEFIEEPVTDPTPQDLDKIKTEVECVLFLDESIKSADDMTLFSSVIDGVNLKLSKCGGLSRTIAMAREARKLRLKLLLGCMIETAIGITAALHISSLFDYFDLDSLLLTDNDPFWGAHFDGANLLIPVGAGLGIKLEDNFFA